LHHGLLAWWRMPSEPRVELRDAELLVSWREGEAAAGEELVRRHYRVVERFLANKVGLERIPDLAQETFVRCVEARDRIDEAARFQTYLLTIAYRVFCAHLRREYRVASTAELDSVTLEAVDPSPSTLMVRKQEQRLLLEGLRAISVNHQVVLELHYWEELTTEEIGQILDIPPPTARSRLRRARSALEAAMAAKARSPALLDSTLTRIEDWAAACRRELSVEPAR